VTEEVMFSGEDVINSWHGRGSSVTAQSQMLANICDNFYK
jgi:hypothetical protein